MVTRLFRKRAVTVEARRINAEDWDSVQDIASWANAEVVDIDMFRSQHDNAVMVILTMEGPMYAEDGDWIIRGVVGEFYPCKNDVFEASYEPVVHL